MLFYVQNMIKYKYKKRSVIANMPKIDSPEENFILNIEPQGYLDSAMSARMLRYRSDIWGYTQAAGLGTPSVEL